jgi:hypothetical protein
VRRPRGLLEPGRERRATVALLDGSRGDCARVASGCAPELLGTAAHRPLVWVLLLLQAAAVAMLVAWLVRGNATLGFGGSAGTPRSAKLPRMFRAAPLLCLLLLAGPVRAQPSTEVEVQVGKTVKLNVGLAQGLNCDDLTIVEAKLVPSKDKKVLVLVLKGKAAGDTYCRAGTGFGHTVLVHVTVTEPEL